MALPAGWVGVFYHTLLDLSGGTQPYLVYLSAGALPRGLALNSFSGDITGIPGAVAVSRFTVYVTDRSHASASRSYQISVTR
jgi:large repetitive protein